jgi:hypothetical protein
VMKQGAQKIYNISKKVERWKLLYNENYIQLNYSSIRLHNDEGSYCYDPE